jgi:hypothetical protein
MITGRARDLFQAIRNVRLGAQIKLHIRVDGKAVVAFFADATPFTIRLRKPLINSKA